MFTFLQQIILGLVNGMVFALIALGYTMVYGILELINFAHGDLFMLASFLALTLVGLLGLDGSSGAVLVVAIPAIIAACVVFAGGLNWLVDRLVYRPLRGAPKLAPLVSAIGVSFMFMNLGLFWGGLPLDVFGGGTTAAAPKGFPNLLPSENLLGAGTTSVKLAAIGSLEHGRLSSHANAGVTVGGLAREVSYAGALALAATSRVTVIGELIGRLISGVGGVTAVSAPHPTLVGVETIRLVPDGSFLNSITVAPGVKWNLTDTWVLAANVTVPLTNDGLTARFTPFVGLDYALGK